MSARVSVRMADDGSGGTAPVAVKLATTPDEIERLAAEADRLERLAHPGLIRLVHHRESADRAELHSTFVGDSLERWQGSIDHAVGVVAAVATTIAELHDQGVTHGRLERNHVLLAPSGRPILCSLSPPPTSYAPADDVRALGLLLDDLLRQRAERPNRWQRLLQPKTPQRRLGQAIARATNAEPERRPTARALAHTLIDAFPRATLPTGPSADDDPDPFSRAFADQRGAEEDEVFHDRPWDESRPAPQARRPAWSGRRKVVAAVGVAAMMAAIMPALMPALTGGQADHDRSEGNAGPPSTPTQATPPPACADDRAPGTSAVDVTGDGCPETVSVAGDGVVTVGNDRWQVGEPGDHIAVGDWDCDGRATPALYRVATGDVFIFADWAEDAGPLVAEPVARVPGGMGLADTRGLTPRPCGLPVVKLADGTHHRLEATP